MRIDQSNRKPFLEGIDATTGFWLRQDDPVSIQVEQVMIHPTRRPRFVVLGSQPIRIRNKAFRHLKMVNKAIAPIRVEWVRFKI